MIADSARRRPVTLPLTLPLRPRPERPAPQVSEAAWWLVPALALAGLAALAFTTDALTSAALR